MVAHPPGAAAMTNHFEDYWVGHDVGGQLICEWDPGVPLAVERKSKTDCLECVLRDSCAWWLSDAFEYCGDFVEEIL
jgi:hypothetical protein